MKSSLIVAFFIIMAPFSWSQMADETYFAYSKATLSTILTDIEKSYKIKYSYADTVVANRIISIQPKKYTLDAIHKAIEAQAPLDIIPINSRYYSLVGRQEEPEKHEELKEILVEGLLSKGINKANQVMLITPQKLDVLPGVTDADIMLSLQQFPGVKSPYETATGLYIRGGTSDQNLILWDGIRMYHPGHLFGMISGYNPNVVEKVRYQNKGTHSKFGERIASVIEMESLDSIPAESRIKAGINGLNADVVLQYPLVREKIGLQLSGRKSFTQYWQSPTFDALAAKVFQNTNFENFDETNRFQFEDYTAKIIVAPGPKSEVTLSGIWIGNQLDFSSETAQQTERNQDMEITNSGYSLNWKQRYSHHFRQELLLHYSGYEFSYDRNDVGSDGDFELFQKKNRIVDSGIDCNFEWVLSERFRWDFGYQLKGNDISHAFTSKNKDLEILLNQKQLYLTSNIGFTQWSYHFSSWKFSAGLRTQMISGWNEVLLEPRTQIQKQFSQKWTVQLSYEKKSQMMSQFRESVANDLSLENYIWILSDNGQYPLQRGQQFTAGVIFKDHSWLLDVDTYYKRMEGITSLTFGFLNPSDAFPHQGRGFVKGLDVLLQKSAPSWKAWLTYSYQDAQNRFEDINENRYFEVNANIRHSFNASVYKNWNDFSLALGWFWRTGKPYSLLNNSNQIQSFNTEQLPSYHRLDLSAMYQFREDRKCSWKVGFSLYNVYNRRTIISKEYERIYTSLPDVINANFKEQNYRSLGIMPNVFLRLIF